MPVVRTATIPIFRGRIFGAAPASATGICANQPCYIRNSTLLFPADSKNAPCSAKIGIAHKLLRKLVDFTAKNRLSLQFLKISLQIANCREERPRQTFSLLTASSATQSVPRGRKTVWMTFGPYDFVHRAASDDEANAILALLFRSTSRRLLMLPRRSPLIVIRA